MGCFWCSGMSDARHFGGVTLQLLWEQPDRYKQDCSHGQALHSQAAAVPRDTKTSHWVERPSFSCQEHMCTLSKPPSPVESSSKVPRSWPMQRMRLWFIHTTAGKLGIVFTEFFTSSSVTSTTVQCSSSSGRGSSPPLVSHGCICVGRNTDSCRSPFYSRALWCWWWEIGAQD